jgi:hypothetical protein
MATLVTAVRPSRSAYRPAMTAPTRPATPIARNVTVPISTAQGGSMLRTAKKKTASQVQSA